MDGNIDDMIACNIKAAEMVVQGKRQNAYIPPPERGPETPCQIPYILIFNDPYPIVEYERGLNGIGVYEYAEKRKNEKGYDCFKHCCRQRYKVESS